MIERVCFVVLTDNIIGLASLPWLVAAEASLGTLADLKLGKAEDCEGEEIGAPFNSSTILFCVCSANSFDLEGRSCRSLLFLFPPLIESSFWLNCMAPSFLTRPRVSCFREGTGLGLLSRFVFESF